MSNEFKFMHTLYLKVIGQLQIMMKIKLQIKRIAINKLQQNYNIAKANKVECF